MSLSDSIGLAFFTVIFTFIANFIFKWLQNKFDFAMDTKKFKRDFYFQQLTELNLELYAIIAQSEFLRYFYDLKNEGTIKDIPFLEPKQTKKKQQKNIFTGETLEESEEIIINSITNFNKMELFEKIISKKQYASQRLIKLAVAYRYCHKYYLKKGLSDSQLERFQKEELRLIHDIVTTVIFETNLKLKFCKMDYIKSEIETSNMDSSVFELSKIIDEKESE